MTYGSIGGIAMLFFILTALASSPDDTTEGAFSVRSTLVFLLSAAAFGLAGEYTLTKFGDAWMSFFVALGIAISIGGPYALVRFLTKKYLPATENTDTTAEPS